jgi:outer membrane immunogenic protein
LCYNWNGGYTGAHIGGVWGDVDVTDDIKNGAPPGPFGYSVDGVFGGGTAGYNLQFDNFVIGIEGDLGFIDPNGSGIIPSSNPIYHQDITLDSGLYGNITGRLGLADLRQGRLRLLRR